MGWREYNFSPKKEENGYFFQIIVSYLNYIQIESIIDGGKAPMYSQLLLSQMHQH